MSGSSSPSSVLVTGGAGYIGSHAVKALRADGANVVVFDNLSAGHAGAARHANALVVGDIHDTRSSGASSANTGWTP